MTDSLESLITAWSPSAGCKCCGQPFSLRPGKKYCSRQCMRRMMHRREKLRRRKAPPGELRSNCKHCGNEFVHYKWAPHQRYCSERCSNCARDERARRRRGIKPRVRTKSGYKNGSAAYQREYRIQHAERAREHDRKRNIRRIAALRICKELGLL